MPQAVVDEDRVAADLQRSGEDGNAGRQRANRRARRRILIPAGVAGFALAVHQPVDAEGSRQGMVAGQGEAGLVPERLGGVAGGELRQPLEFLRLHTSVGQVTALGRQLEVLRNVSGRVDAQVARETERIALALDSHGQLIAARPGIHIDQEQRVPVVAVLEKGLPRSAEGERCAADIVAAETQQAAAALSQRAEVVVEPQAGVELNVGRQRTGGGLKCRRQLALRESREREPENQE